LIQQNIDNADFYRRHLFVPPHFIPRHIIPPLMTFEILLLYIFTLHTTVWSYCRPCSGRYSCATWVQCFVLGE